MTACSFTGYKMQGFNFVRQSPALDGLGYI